MPAFSDNPWMASLPKVAAEALFGAATAMRLSAGEYAFHQGDKVSEHGGAFFGLARGLLKLQMLHPDGKEAILAVVEPGNWVGEVAILDHTPRAYAAVALADSDLLAVSAARFNALMQQIEFAQAIARLLAGRLRLAYGMMGDSALQSTRERVAHRLVLLAHGDVTLSASGRTTLNTSQDIVAMMLGISRPTLNKELQALAELGAISLRYGRIEIKDAGLLLANCAGTR
jgi:CRP/FNR family transcriptional regulator, cyclic AMP receptor protein